MYSRHQQLFLLVYVEKHIIEGSEHIATIRRLIAEGRAPRRRAIPLDFEGDERGE
jgi:hypothetical protein